MKRGYARVSSSGQHLDVQRTALTDAGCEKIYAEKESGVKERPVLKELLSFIRQGDTLVVYKLDRLGRFGSLSGISQAIGSSIRLLTQRIFMSYSIS